MAPRKISAAARTRTPTPEAIAAPTPKKTPAPPKSTYNQPLRANLTEIGSTGLTQIGNIIGDLYETIDLNFVGPQWRNTIKKMVDTDATIGAVLFAIEMLMRQVEWSVQPADDTPEAADYAQFIESCLGDMSMSWHDTLSEILTFLPYGFSFHEIVYKRRLGSNPKDGSKNSNYNDGRIGWRKWPIRGQVTVDHWDFDEDGGIRGMYQRLANFELVYIPIEKGLLFRTTSRMNSPEGRALALDTPVPTPTGWTTMGDIQVGDEVYSDTGQICRVVAKSPVWKDRPTYAMTFRNGETIYADENHLWPVQIRGVDALLTTKEIARRYAKGLQQPYKIPVVGPLEGLFTDLPVPPYALGVWLGDGDTNRAYLTYGFEDEEIVAHVASSGVTCVPVRPSGGAGKARIGSFKDNPGRGQNNFFWNYIKGKGKCIPDEYMRADVHSRMELLQGLMDSDGTIDKRGACCIFVQRDRDLAEQVLELVRGLGFKARLEYWDYDYHTSYRVVFTAYSNNPPFKMSRKVGLLRESPSHSIKTNRHSIVSVIECDTRDTVCIEVDSPTHCFLVGNGLYRTHNSILLNAYRSYYFRKHIENIEGIGIERDLAGMPVAYVPWQMLTASATDEQKQIVSVIQKIVTNIKRDEQEGIVFPVAYDDKGNKEFDLKLLATGGSRQFSTNEIIDRYGLQIAMTMLADFVFLGHKGVGSFALSSNKMHFFSSALKSWLDSIAAVINAHAIPRLMVLNGFSTSKSPVIVHEDIENAPLGELGGYIEQLAKAGLLNVTPELQRYLLEAANLPAPRETLPATMVPDRDEEAGDDNSILIPPGNIPPPERVDQSPQG